MIRTREPLFASVTGAASSTLPGLIETVRFALDHQYHVVLEGILFSGTYRPLIAALWQARRGSTYVFYLDVSWEETLRRHATRPQAAEFSAEQMRGWYRPRDLLGWPDEHLVPETSSTDATIALLSLLWRPCRLPGETRTIYRCCRTSDLLDAD